MKKIYCDEVLRTPEAQESFEELADLARQQPICLLCFERDPALCHRRILANRLAERGMEVVDLTVF
jgi:uncharacterized protein (DUF488 family)